METVFLLGFFTSGPVIFESAAALIHGEEGEQTLYSKAVEG